MRGQFAYRPANTAGTQIAVMGILETPVNALPINRLLTFGGFGSITGFSGALSAPPATLPPSRDPVWARCLGDVLTTPIWNRASGLFDVFQCYTRKACVLDTDQDLLLFCGIFQPLTPCHDTGFGAIAITDQRWTFSTPTQPDLSAWRGNTHDAVLHLPIWGWDAAPWALQTTLEPTLAADVDTLRALLLRQDGTGMPLDADELATYDRLRRSEAGSVLHTTLTDSTFRAYLHAKVHASGLASLSSFGTVTATDMTSRDQAVRDLVRALI